MQDNLYCEPCRRLLRGELSVISHNEHSITFDHHHDFESFETAMQISCTICSLAYTYATNTPSAFSWVKSLGFYYCYGGERWLRFFPDSPSGWSKPSNSLAITPWSSLSDYTISYDLSFSTQSDSAVNFLVEKYHNCRKEHVQCNLVERSNPVTYPSRLLDVGIEEHSVIILRSTETFRDEKYVCLSHCWGNCKPFTLNAETQSALSEGINTVILPKTFQDAIGITRRLKVQYLWIDSLCIIQDNKDDWATESSRMGNIYAHATCTIAATASKDSSGGLFFARDPQLLIPRRVDFEFSPTAPWLEKKSAGFALAGTYLCDVLYLAGKWIEEAPLNSRAWVSQERQLSRQILHFTEKQLFWECNELTACETYPEGLPYQAESIWFSDATTLKKDLCRITDQGKESSAKGLDSSTYRAWGIYRWQYSKCALTHHTDKLVAIQGIANRVSQVTGDKFVAGLWRSRIVEELCWFAKDPRTGASAEWRAPTWSWASRDGEIIQSLLVKYHSEHPDRHVEAELVDLDVRAKTSGELEDASMKIKCRPLPAIFTPAAALNPPNNDVHGELEVIDQGGDILVCRTPKQIWAPAVCLRVDDDAEIMEPQHGFVVVLQHCLHSGARQSTKKSHHEAEEEIEGSESVEESEREEESDIEEEYDSEEESGGTRIQKTDYVEALFLQMSDKVDGKFERIGLISFQRFRAVNQVLKAHRMAEEKVITLI